MSFFKAVRWRNLSIRKKLTLIYLLISIIPVITLGYYLTNSLSQSFIENLDQSNRASVKIFSRDFNNRLDSFDNAIYSFTTDNRNIMDFLTTNFDSDITAYETYKKDVEDVVDKADGGQAGLKLLVLSNNSTLGFSNIFVNRLYDSGFDYKTLPPENVLFSMKMVNWEGIRTIDGDKYLVSYTPIRDYTNFGDPIALLYVYMNLDYPGPLADSQKDSGNMIYVVDGNGKAIYSNTGNETVPDTQDSRCTINGKRYMLLTQNYSNSGLSINNWTILYYVPLNVIDSTVGKIWRTTVWIVLICLVLTFVIIRGFSGSINRRIKTLIGSMRSFESGDTKSRAESRHGDELGQLNVIFNGMADKIDHLISETLLARIKLQETEIEKHKAENANKDAQLLYLQSQINPHYLYNTLESIRMRTLVNGDNRTAHIIRIFANSFREIMYSKDKDTTIEKELSLVKDFFTIQKYRFGSKLDYAINCEPGLESMKIPRFTIQPLVENSIFHGLEPTAGNGRIEVSICRENNRVAIIVSDNGTGMEEHRLEELLASVRGEGDPKHGLALRNIYTRLKILYKDEMDFDISSSPENGTSIHIRIPEVV